jgi:hypothetical protein
MAIAVVGSIWRSSTISTEASMASYEAATGSPGEASRAHPSAALATQTATNLIRIYDKQSRGAKRHKKVMLRHQEKLCEAHREWVLRHLPAKCQEPPEPQLQFARDKGSPFLESPLKQTACWLGVRCFFSVPRLCQYQVFYIIKNVCLRARAYVS